MSFPFNNNLSIAVRKTLISKFTILQHGHNTKRDVDSEAVTSANIEYRNLELIRHDL